MFGNRTQVYERLNDNGVVNSAQSINFITLSEVKARVGITGTSEDTYLEGLISSVCQHVEFYIRRPVRWRKVTETILKPLPGNIVLSTRPVVAVTSLTIDGSTVGSQTYTLDGSSGIIYPTDDDIVFSDTRKIVVVYRAGYTPTEIPDALKHAAIEWVKALRFERNRDPAVSSERADNVGTINYVWGASAASEAQLISSGRHGGTAPVTVAALLNSYIKRV